MNFNLFIAYPKWFLIFCLLAGLAYGLILYYKADFTKNKSFFRFPNIFLFTLRFLVVSFISFLLLSPFVRKYFEHVEKPIVVVASDNSKSILLNKDSAYYKNAFTDQLKEMSENLEKKYEIHTISFGEGIEDQSAPSFNSEATNLNQLFEYIRNQYYNKNLGALVLSSDGIYNQGANPLKNARNLKAPIYTVALGDTTDKKDLLINDVVNNPVAYVGNSFPVEVEVEAVKLKGQTFKLSISSNGKQLESRKISISSGKFKETYTFLIEAKETGLQKFTINAEKLENEISYRNNVKNVFIDILENKKRILILANSPHPDIAALSRSIKRNDNYELNTYFYRDFKSRYPKVGSELEKYDLTILHQLPSENNQAGEVLDYLKGKSRAVLFIFGTQTDIGKFNNLGTGLQIKQRKKSFNESMPVLNQDFTYFNIDDDISGLLDELPPLIVPFGNYLLAFENQVLLSQKIGNVKSDLPLVLFMQELDHRKGFICGEGLWKWPLIEYKLMGNSNYFDLLVNKSIQFLTLKSDQRFFRLKDFKNEFLENEPVYFECILLNQNFEKLKDAEIRMQITDENGKTYDYVFQESDAYYKINAGIFKEGSYRFKAQTTVNSKTYKLQGTFVVKKNDLEYLNTKADHDLMYQLANLKGGKMFLPNQLKTLEEDLFRSDFKNISYFDQETKDLINLKWLLYALVFLLSIEWFVRKYFGKY